MRKNDNYFIQWCASVVRTAYRVRGHGRHGRLDV